MAWRPFLNTLCKVLVLSGPGANREARGRWVARSRSLAEWAQVAPVVVSCRKGRALPGRAELEALQCGACACVRVAIPSSRAGAGL